MGREPAAETGGRLMPVLDDPAAVAGLHAHLVAEGYGKPGKPITVAAWKLPKSARPRLEAGRPMMVAEVYPDDSMMLRAQSAAEWLAENDL